MAILGSLVTGEPDLIPPKLSGLTLFQRLIRKVKLVLIVKHCIDDLKSRADARHCGEILERTYVTHVFLLVHDKQKASDNSLLNITFDFSEGRKFYKICLE